MSNADQTATYTPPPVAADGRAAAPAAAIGAGAGPISDLSYRGYDGPLLSRGIRWWIVALAGLRLRGWARTGYIVCISFSLLAYLFIGFMLWLVSRFPQMGPGMQAIIDPTVGQKYASALYTGLNWSMFLLMIVMLIAGSASIAADNQSNALQVYLAKPITKSDYLIGKWAGVFMLVFFAAVLPALLLYIFCLLSYLSDGFLRQEPWLFFRMIGACAVVAAVFASTVIGISAWSKSSSVAAAIAAAVYIATGTISFILRIVIIANSHRGERLEVLTAMRTINVYHSSLNGVAMGLAQWIYGFTAHQMTGPGMNFQTLNYRPPTPWIMGAAALAIVVGGILAARARIRAVEVVTG